MSWLLAGPVQAARRARCRPPSGARPAVAPSPPVVSATETWGRLRPCSVSTRQGYRTDRSEPAAPD
ncbi:hypothetical protein INR49_002835 [Caranx melampygus]|nr:hypothetical protein INR49_002835 [Caranx melampygus]